MKKTLLLALVLGVGIALFLFLFSPQNPIFTLDDADATYRIVKKEDTYYIVKINPSRFIDPKAPFEGSAMKISGAKFNLDDYLNKEVKVEGRFSKNGGIHSYYITKIESIHRN